MNGIIKKYNILITDHENGCGIKYEDLLNVALASNNTNIVNMINKCYYEKKYEKNCRNTKKMTEYENIFFSYGRKIRKNSDQNTKT